MKRILPTAALAGMLTVGLLAPSASALPSNATPASAPQPDNADLVLEYCTLDDFEDNQPGSAYYKAVRWLSCMGDAVGESTDNRFGKTDNIKRAHTLAFLYRAVEPDFEAPEESPFTDVNPGGAFFTPITWAASAEVTVGYADGTFKSSQAITRGEFAAYLYRLADPEHTAPDTSPFGDVNPGGANYAAITWMAEQEITVGHADGNFHQSEAITRAEVAAFIYRSALAPIPVPEPEETPAG